MWNSKFRVTLPSVISVFPSFTASKISFLFFWWLNANFLCEANPVVISIKDTVEIIDKNYSDQPPVDIHDIKRFKEDKRIKYLLKNAKAIGDVPLDAGWLREGVVQRAIIRFHAVEVVRQ